MNKKTVRGSEIDMLISVLPGKTKKEAIDLCKQGGYLPRITKEDENHFVVTHDFRFDRINLEIEKGIVTKANLG